MPFKDPERQKEYHREYYLKHAERLKKRISENYWRGTKYGLSKDKYEEMYKLQNFCCKICGTHSSELTLGLVIDHCHDTGKVRGLLCQYCNTALGMFGDNVEGLEKAISYLKGEF